MDTRTVTAASERDPALDVVHPQLVLVIDRAQPLAAGARHSLANIERVTVGRGPRRAAARVVADGRATLKILLPDERASSLHAVLERRGAGWHLSDCGSTNGSRVGGRTIRETELEDGEVIEIGQTFFRYRAAVSTPFDAAGDVDAADVRGLPRAFGTLLPWLTRDLETLSRVARSDVSVLLRGETGTGKEVLARAIHAESGRKGQFVAVNCGALPVALVESLLFGHKRGAFSGAAQDELGLVRTAEGGTLFLDEIGDLGAAAQAAVLRVLQEREVLPLGATRPIATDVRIVAATHRPIETLAGAGEFRQDLLARIGGFTYALPPLRDRIDDLGMLVAALLGKVAGERASATSLASDLVYAMLAYDWPFNVREVEQRLRTGAILAVDGRILLAHVWKDGPPGAGARHGSSSVPPPKALSKEDAALHADLVAKLGEHGGNVTRVGELMGKRRTTVQRWMRRLGIDPDRFRR
jgi:transcriptional regulator of acetoin/glycerol metabolism